MSTNQNRPPFTENPQSERDDFVECSHCKNLYPVAEGNGSDEFPLCGICDDD